jgi:hypothetical protein
MPPCRIPLRAASMKAAKHHVVTEARNSDFPRLLHDVPTLGSTQHPMQYVSGALSLGVKRPGREADHSPPASAEIKKMWIYTFTPPYAFMA